MYSLSCVPCVQISSTNLSNWWKQLIDCINDSDFVALDLVINGFLHLIQSFLILFSINLQELSGLGDRHKLNAK